jgi:hypothetical protein
VAIASALAAFDTDQHARTVDVTHLERRHLGDPQACAIGNGQGGTMLEAFGRSQQPRDFFATQHRGQLARIAQANQLTGQIRPVERLGKEEAQCSHGAVHPRCVHAKLGLINLEPANIFGRGGVRRAAEEGCKTGDDADVRTAGLLREPAHRHVFGETLAQSADSSRQDRLVHDRLLLVEGSHHVQSGAASRSIQTCHWVLCDTVTSGDLPRSGFVLRPVSAC